MPIKAQASNLDKQSNATNKAQSLDALSQEKGYVETINRVGTRPQLLLPDHIVQLQRTIGNRAIGRLLQKILPMQGHFTKNPTNSSLIQLTPEEDIRRELQHRFHQDQRPEIAVRRERLRQIFGSLEPADTRQIYGLLTNRGTTPDSLAVLFRRSLSHVVREELLAILRTKLDGISRREQEADASAMQSPQTADQQIEGGVTHPLYVDNFVEVIYDMFDPPGPNLSKLLRVHYADGTIISISIDEISDGNTVAIAEVLSSGFFYIGAGGRTFPRQVNRGTVPNLWRAKREALILMDDYNVSFISMAMVPIMLILSPPAMGEMPTIRRLPRTPPFRRSYEGGRALWGRWEDYPHVTLDEREYAQIGNRLYTRHAVDRMHPSGYAWAEPRVAPGVQGGGRGTGGQGQIRVSGRDYGRGVSPENVEHVIASGSRTRIGDRRTSIQSGSVEVITESYRNNQDGIVITIITH